VLAWLEYAALRGLTAVISHLPFALQDLLARGLARVATVVDRRHSEAGRRYLEQAFGAELTVERREALLRSSWRHLFLGFLEAERFEQKVVRAADPASHFEVVACDDLERVRASGTGAIMIACHVGAWEAMSFWVANAGFRPFYAVARAPKNRPLSIHMQRTREARGLRILNRKGAVQGIQRVVAAGGYVGLLLDQRAKGRTVLAPFFGRPAQCERSVAVLMRRLKVPVVFTACYRTERPFYYESHVPRVLWPEDIQGMSPEEILTEINREYERMILARPEQYWWIHDRYRNAPAADASTVGEPAVQL
jgi:KDO2-lipid IV(A) lauroyltransferase